MSKQIPVPKGAIYAHSEHQEVTYGLAPDGQIFALASGRAFTLPESIEPYVRKKNFPTSTPPAQRRRTLSDLSFESQTRYHDAADILAGTKQNVPIADRRRATRYLHVVHEWLNGENKGSSG